MGSLKARFAILFAGSAVLVLLAAAAVLASIGVAERTVDRTLAAQGRLELLAELSGRLTQFGLAAVETVGNPDGQPEAMAIARVNVDKALVAVDEAMARSFRRAPIRATGCNTPCARGRCRNCAGHGRCSTGRCR